MMHFHEATSGSSGKYAGENLEFGTKGQEQEFYLEHARWLRFTSFTVISDLEWSELERDHVFEVLPCSSYGLCVLSWLVDIGFKTFLDEAQARRHHTTKEAYNEQQAEKNSTGGTAIGFKKRSFLPAGLSIGPRAVSSGGDGDGDGDVDDDEDEKVESYKSLRSSSLSSKQVAPAGDQALPSTGSIVHPLDEHSASSMRHKPSMDYKATSRPIWQRLKKRFGIIFFFFLLAVIIICTSLPVLLVFVFLAIAISVFALFCDMISVHKWAKFLHNIINSTAPALVSFFIQGTALAALYGSLPLYGDEVNSGFCVTTSFVQCGLLAVFYSTLVPTFFEILHELMIVFFADMACFRQPGEAGMHVVFKVDLHYSPFFRLRVSSIIWLELLIWFGVGVCGTKYILTQQTISNLIQACVAISFINEIDNLFFSAFFMQASRERVCSSYFRLPVREYSFKFLQESIDRFFVTYRIESIAQLWVIGSHIYQSCGGTLLLAFPVILVVVDLKKSRCDGVEEQPFLDYLRFQ